MRSLPPDKVRILVLDDSDLVRSALAITFGNAGYPVAGAAGMTELEALWQKFRPDVLLTDVDMPGVSGSDVCQVLKSRLAGRLVPVILMSAMPEDELAPLAERCGAEGYVCKAGGPRAILRALEAVLEGIVF
jgi:two-component system invasion response regulator UvrY